MGDWFTPSKSDHQSGAEYNAQYNAMNAGMPQTPTIKDAAAAAEKKARGRKVAQAGSKSVYTSPLGLSGQADVTKKSLLGQ